MRPAIATGPAQGELTSPDCSPFPKQNRDVPFETLFLVNVWPRDAPAHGARARALREARRAGADRGCFGRQREVPAKSQRHQRATGLIVWALLALSMEAKPKHEFPLSAPVSASIAVGGGASCRLMVRKGEPRLTVVCGASKQDIRIPILEVEGEPTFEGQILVDDFDFDGYQDLMVPTATGYGGVNWFYDLYRYQAPSRSFRPLERDDEGDFCNPEELAAEKTLRTPCKDGPAWYDDAYKFAAGKLYHYRSTELVHLNGFEGDDAVIYGQTYYGPERQVLRRAVAEATSEAATVRRRIPGDRAHLHRTPAADGRTESYLVKGDQVELLEVKLEGEQQWVRLAYQSAKAGRLVRWIVLPPE